MVKLTDALVTAAGAAFPIRFRQRHLDFPKNPLFSSLSREQLRLILPTLKHRRVRRGRAILEEGGRNPGKIYIILEGDVAVAKEAISPIDKRPATYEIGILRRGDIFGEVSFIEGTPSAATYIAKSDIRVAVVDLSAARRSLRIRRLRNIVVTKLRRYLAGRANESVSLRLTTLKMENEFTAYRAGVGHIVVTILCLLSFYTLALSFMPAFKSLSHANFMLTPLIILFFGASFIPIVATSGFPPAFFGLCLGNWRAALSYSLQASVIFLIAILFAKWVLINTSPAFADIPLIGDADVKVDGHQVPLTLWYWSALAIYILLTPMQEFVARSAIQAPLYAFLLGTDTKRRWVSIMVSNIVFSAVHAHINLAFALLAFFPGLLWGWIFARTNSLLAATFSHLLVGGTAIFIFGVESIVAKLAI